MYFIQGADQKQYGPITAEQLRQWIAENRLNRTSQCRAEASTDWKPLGEFPEFADAFTPAASAAGAVPAYQPPLAGAPASDAVASMVKPPAIGILVTGALNALMALAGIVMNLLGVNKGQQVPPGLPPQYEQMLKAYIEFMEKFGVVINFAALAVAGVVILGAIRMLQLRSHGVVLAGIILAMLPCFSGCCCIGIPFGIWALVVLNKPEVKASFR
jgi:hypothetical protein